MNNVISEHCEPGLVTVIMRTVGDRPREIRRAILSVGASIYSKVELILVYQGGDDQRALQLAQHAELLPRGFRFRLERNVASGDCRSRNLNIGLRAAQGQYICFLDDDDMILPVHIHNLVGAIADSSKAWAYSQTLLRYEDTELNVVADSQPFLQSGFSLQAIWRQNFIPLHSFMLDRRRIDDSLRHEGFCEELTRSEDWDFLLRLSFYHAPVVLPDTTCIYCIGADARNTNVSLMPPDVAAAQKHKAALWAEQEKLLRERMYALARRFWWAEDILLPWLSGERQAPGLLLRVTRKLSRIVNGIERYLEGRSL